MLGLAAAALGCTACPVSGSLGWLLVHILIMIIMYDKHKTMANTACPGVTFSLVIVKLLWLCRLLRGASY